MTPPTFRPLIGHRDCDSCVGLQGEACLSGDTLTFVWESTDKYPRAVRVYVHPPDIDLESLSVEARAEYRGPWYPSCPLRCEVLRAFTCWGNPAGHESAAPVDTVLVDG